MCVYSGAALLKEERSDSLVYYTFPDPRRCLLSIFLCPQELEEVIADPSMASITLVEEERHHVRIVGTR